jgi:hypothetical protein
MTSLFDCPAARGRDSDAHGLGLAALFPHGFNLYVNVPGVGEIEEHHGVLRDEAWLGAPLQRAGKEFQDLAM